MKVLHLFNNYLPKTQTWAFNLLRLTPGNEAYIGANLILNDNWESTNIHQASHGVFDHLWVVRAIIRRIPIWGNHLGKKFENWARKRYIKKVLVPLCDKEGIHLIHAHFANVGYQFHELKQLTGLPYIVSFYGMDYEYVPFNQPTFIEYYQQLFRIANGFICEGEHGKKILESTYLVPSQKINVIPLGVEVKNIQFIPRKKQAGQLQLLQIASYVEKKGHQYTLYAFSLALKKSSNIHLTLVGSGPLKSQIKQLVNDLGLVNKVTFIDFIDYSKLHLFLKAFDVFIHPSCYAENRDCEGGAPVVILDVAASGMPVISTKHCDIPAEVIDNKTGLLCEEKDIKMLSQNILRFTAMNQQEYDRFAVAARNHIVKNFDVKINTKSLAEYYQRFLEKTNR